MIGWHKIFADASVRMPNADIWFALPAGFTVLPLDEFVRSEHEKGDGEIRPSAMHALVESVNSPEERQELLTLLAPVHRVFHLLLQSGVIHCSMGLHRDDEGDGDVLPSLFTLSGRETAWAPRSVTVSRLAGGSPDTGHLEVLSLPCGPASLAERVVSYEVEGVTREILQVAVHVPYPEATKLATLTLSTTAVHRADRYRDLLREVARMVTFSNPLAAEDGV